MLAGSGDELTTSCFSDLQDVRDLAVGGIKCFAQNVSRSTLDVVRGGVPGANRKFKGIRLRSVCIIADAPDFGRTSYATTHTWYEIAGRMCHVVTFW